MKNVSQIRGDQKLNSMLHESPIYFLSREKNQVWIEFSAPNFGINLI